MSRKNPNRGRDQDVYLAPHEQVRPTPLSAADLTPDQVRFLLEMSVRNGGHPADRCYTFWGFEATDADRRIIDNVIEVFRAEWEPWLKLARETCRPAKPRAVPRITGVVGIS
jgi:hypothetical protein